MTDQNPMDIIQKESVKIPNAVIVSGIAGDQRDVGIEDFLKQYGSIIRVLKVSNLSPEFPLS